jgi:hypothetical protein
MTSERLCVGQPSARSPRTALQNGGWGEEPHLGMAGTDCAQMSAAPRNDASTEEAVKILQQRFIVVTLDAIGQIQRDYRQAASASRMPGSISATTSRPAAIDSAAR